MFRFVKNASVITAMYVIVSALALTYLHTMKKKDPRVLKWLRSPALTLL